MSFEIVREKPYFVNADGEKKTYIDMGYVMSFTGVLIAEDGEQIPYRFGYDANSNKYLGIEIVSEDRADDFEELYVVYLCMTNLEISLEFLEQKIAEECFSNIGHFIIKRISETYDCFFS